MILLPGPRYLVNKHYLVKKGPPEIILDDFPCQGDGRYFSKVHLKRKLLNGEIKVNNDSR